jgi:hypothetical protein
MRRTEIISAALLVAFGLVMIAVVIPKYVAGGGQQTDLAPAFMPYVAVGIMTLVMAIFLVMKFVRPMPSDAEPNPLPIQSWIYIGLVSAIFVATFFIMSSFGFLLGGIVIVGGFMALARTSILPLVGITLAFPVAVWLTVEKLLGIVLP